MAKSSDVDTLPPTPRPLAHHAVTLLSLAALALMLLPCFVQFSPVSYFDVDPRSPVGRQPLTAIAPAGAAWLHMACVVLAGLAVGASSLAGGRIRWWSLLGAGVFSGLALWHMPESLTNTVYLGAWIGAVWLAVAVLHLAQHAHARLWLLAGLVAALVPMFLQAGWYLFVEHPATVQAYLDSQKAILDARGIEAGSDQAMLYERRLRSADAVGKFGLANVFGSVLVGFTLLSAGVGLAAAGRRRFLAMGVAGLAALAGLVTIWWTHSKGAVLAVPLGLAVLALAGLAARWPKLRVGVAAVVVVLPLVAIGGILARGAVGPPDSPAGERSILFRYHYLQAGARVYQHDPPSSWLAGVGPTGFHRAYLWAKNPLNPEEVQSMHNVLADLIVMLGVGGIAGSALLLGWVVLGAMRQVPFADQGRLAGDTDSLSAGRAVGWLAVGVGLVVWLTQARAELPMLDGLGLLRWGFALGCFVVVLALLRTRLVGTSPWLGAGALAAGAAVVIHNQLEMSFYQPGSALVVWPLVALAAAGVSSGGPYAGGDAQTPAGTPQKLPPTPQPIAGLAAGGVLLAGAVGLVVTYAAPLASGQAKLAGAAFALQHDQPAKAVELLDDAAAQLPFDRTLLRWRVGLRIEGAFAVPDVPARRLLAEAQEAVDSRIAAAPDKAATGVFRLGAIVHEEAARRFRQPADRQRAIGYLQQVVVLAPWSSADHIELGDLYWDFGDTQRAAEMYRRALLISEKSYLDPARVLPEAERERLAARVAVAAGKKPVSTGGQSE